MRVTLLVSGPLLLVLLLAVVLVLVRLLLQLLLFPQPTQQCRVTIVRTMVLLQ